MDRLYDRGLLAGALERQADNDGDRAAGGRGLGVPAILAWAKAVRRRARRGDLLLGVSGGERAAKDYQAERERATQPCGYAKHTSLQCHRRILPAASSEARSYVRVGTHLGDFDAAGIYVRIASLPAVRHGYLGAVGLIGVLSRLLTIRLWALACPAVPDAVGRWTLRACMSSCSIFLTFSSTLSIDCSHLSC
jgi:hypothetical protein